MPVTEYAIEEIPKYRQAKFNERMQAFVDKFTGQTIQEINNLTGETVGQVAPTILNGLASSINLTSLVEGQVVHFIATADTVLTVQNADTITDYTTYSPVDTSAIINVTDGTTLMLWWEADGADKTCNFIKVINASSGNGGNGGGGAVASPVTPNYTVEDVSSTSYELTDY